MFASLKLGMEIGNKDTTIENCASFLYKQSY